LVGDPVKLRQVISNFVSNSVKFTDQGHIYVTAVLEEETDQTTIIAFQVEDTGIGISQQEIDKLFQPFSQITTSSIHNYGGTGLGLAISKNFIEMMSGEITVSSTPGEGTIFQFTLRFNKAEAELASISPNLPDLVDTTNDNTDLVIPKESSMVDYTPSVIKILLAEDNEINIELFTSLLHMNGYFCDLAKNGIEAVNLCKNNHYDIIFMDCQMPELDGFDAAAKIRSMELSTEHTYIIALTSYATMEDVEKCKQSGMDDFISKPIHLDQVLQILKTVLVAKSNLDSSSSCDIM
jgi:CheY-like chemotaxis protein